MARHDHRTARIGLARAHGGVRPRQEIRPPRDDARKQLHTAHDLLEAIGMDAFAARARKELTAIGERVRKPQDEDGAALTSQEVSIARLARDGLTNPEIGARLFLSARTVEWHLRKVYTKLGVRSRRELRSALTRFDRGGRSAGVT